MHRTMPRRAFMAHAAALSAGTLALPSYAQAYPDRPIKVLQGFAAGGNADTIARVVGVEMAKDLGQPLVVEAQTGAGGTIAAAAVARAQPDGYTLLLATGGHAVAGALYNKLPYRSVADFQMVSTITFFPFLLLVPAGSQYADLPELLAAARRAPGSIAFGTAGIGSTHHLAGELLAKSAGVKLLHVPYRGDAAAVTALLGQEVPFIIAPPTAVLGHLKAGKMRAIAVTGPRRWAAMPEVPTVAEQGVVDYDVRSWAGWMLPAGASVAVVERLQHETAKALLVPSVRKRLEDMGGEAQASTPQEMAAMVAAELRKWTTVVADAGIPKL